MDSMTYLQNILETRRRYHLVKAYAEHLHQSEPKEDHYQYSSPQSTYMDSDRNETVDARHTSCIDLFDDTFMGKVYSDNPDDRVYAATQIGKVVKQMESLDTINSCLDRILGNLAILNHDTNVKVLSATLYAYESLLNFLREKDLSLYLRPLVTCLIVHLGRDEVVGQKAMKAIHRMLAQADQMSLLRILLEDWTFKPPKVRVEIMTRVIASLLVYPKAKYDVKFLIKTCVKGLNDDDDKMRAVSFECALILMMMSTRDQHKLVAYVVRRSPTTDSMGMAAKIKKRLDDRHFPVCDSDGFVHIDWSLHPKIFERDLENKINCNPNEHGDQLLNNEIVPDESVQEESERLSTTPDESTKYFGRGDAVSLDYTSPDGSEFNESLKTYTSNMTTPKRKYSQESGAFAVQNDVLPFTSVQKKCSDPEICLTSNKRTLSASYLRSPKKDSASSELSVGSNGTYVTSQATSKKEESIHKGFIDPSRMFSKKRVLSVLERWENANPVGDNFDLEPLLNPYQTIDAAFAILCEPFDSQKDWYKRKEAIKNLCRIAKHHAHLLFGQRRLALITVCHHVRKVPIVARAALKTLREIIEALGCFNNQEAELVMATLLDEYGVTQYKNMKEDIIFTLTNVISKISYQNAALLLTSIRKHTKSKASVELEAKLLRDVVVELGAQNCLVEENSMAASILSATAVFLKSTSPVTRHYARRIVQVLMTSLDFERLIRRHLTRRCCDDIREAVIDIKRKGIGRSPQQKQKQMKKIKLKKNCGMYALSAN